MYKIDVKRQVEEMERVLRAAGDADRCQATITILRRWQFDEMLDDASRERARTLVVEFESSFPSTTDTEALAAQGVAGALSADLPGKTS